MHCVASATAELCAPCSFHKHKIVYSVSVFLASTDLCVKIGSVVVNLVILHCNVRYHLFLKRAVVLYMECRNVCLPRAWNCVCSVLSPQARNCNTVSVGTELCEHDLCRCRMMCLWFPQAQALCKTLFMYYICINVYVS